MDTRNRPAARPPAALLAAAGILALVILAPALLATGNGTSASSLNPQLADAPAGLVPLAF